MEGKSSVQDGAGIGRRADTLCRKVGIMGGTFDPIHIGHLLLAECAFEQFHLDRVLFLPAGNPPHKPSRPGGASDKDRLNMVSLAIRNNPHFLLDPEEMQRGGLSYTNDTLVRLCQRNAGTEFYFIIGADSLMTFEHWKNPEKICQNCILAVAVRDGLDTDVIEEKMRELKRRYHAQIFLLHSPEVEISSSHLRKLCREGRSIRYYVTDEVMNYIEKNELYRG